MTNNLTNNRNFLREDQYKHANNLRARITLHERFSTNPTDWYIWLFGRYNFPPDTRILEIGCGPGDFWEHNRESIPQSWQLTLTDLSEGMLDQARQKLAGIPIKLCCLDADVFAFPGDSFEVVIGNHMLYHVTDKERTLAEIKRVLTSTGQLITATTGEGHLQELHEIIKRFDPSYQPVHHTVSFTLENGEALLSKFFNHVDRFDFPNALKITEAPPIVDYALSLWTINQDYFQQNLNEFRVYIQNLLDTDGFIRVTKSEGVLVSRQPLTR